MMVDTSAAVSKLDSVPASHRDNSTDNDNGSEHLSVTSPASFDKDVSSSAASATRSSRAKQKMVKNDTPTSSVTEEKYDLVHLSFLQNLVASVACPSCHQQDLVIEETHTKGLAVKYSIKCDVCESEVFHDFTSPLVGGRRDINYRVVLGSRKSGINHPSLKRLFATMNLACPLHHSTYGEISKELQVALKPADV